MALLERERQLGQLGGLLAQAGLGRGRIVAISGEAGAGKTSLVQAFADQMVDPARVFRSACEDLSTPDPLGPLRDLARHAKWTTGWASDPRQSRLSLFASALEVFETTAQPTVLVVEDLHWADDATLDFVRFLGRRLRDRHILLLMTTRNDESEGQRRLRRALADIPVDDVVRIDVPRLTKQAVSTLSDEAGRDGRAVYRATAGNAFFVMELLRDGIGETPSPSVVDTVLARAERLSGGARTALKAVSVFPRQAEAEVVQALCGPESTAYTAECVSAGLLIDLGDAVSFRHEIARRAVEMALPESVRRELNADVLSSLRSGPAVPVARLVHHAIEAHDREAVLELAPIAAEHASRLGAHREAARHYKTALDQAQILGPEERADIYERYAFEAHIIGELQQALEAEREALQLRQRQGDSLRQGDCLRWLSRFSYIAGDRRSAVEYGEQAIELLETMPPGSELAMAYSNQSQLDMLEAKVEPVLRHGEKAIALAETLGRSDIVCHALNNIGTAEAWVNADRGRQNLDRSLEIALHHNFQEHAARAFINRAWIDVNMFAFRQAESVLRSGIEYCVERDIDPWRDYLKGWLAELHLREGQWDLAVEVALQVVSNANATPLVRHPAVTALARVRLRRGEAGIDELFEELWHFLKKGMEPQRLAPYATLKAERAWLEQSDPQEALGLLAQSEGGTASRAVFGELIYWQHILAPDQDLGDTSAMAEPYRKAFAGNWRGASLKWAELGAPFERGLALLEGDDGPKRQALAIFDSLGAKAVAQHVRHLMRRDGVSRISRGPRQTTLANWAGLTGREMEVLQLVGRGFSNKKIARHLSISPKTVDHHVTAVLSKLEVSSRGEAAALARGHGLIKGVAEG